MGKFQELLIIQFEKQSIQYEKELKVRESKYHANRYFISILHINPHD